MIEVGFLAWSGFYGGTIGNLLLQWEQFGIFSYLIPFLMIFALVFGILNQMKLFQENKAINSILALAVGLMSLQFDFVPRFFSEVFPRVGVGLAIILVIIILAGLFIDPSKPGIGWTLLAVGAVIIIVVLINTSTSLGWNIGSGWLQQNWDVILGLIIFLVLIGVIVGSSKPRSDMKPYAPVMFRHYSH
ncbi:MAG: hypothetical protein AABW51_01110 [Nanoarchaeota archaeon]